MPASIRALEKRYAHHFAFAESVAVWLHPHAEVVLHDLASDRIVKLWNNISRRNRARSARSSISNPDRASVLRRSGWVIQRRPARPICARPSPGSIARSRPTMCWCWPAPKKVFLCSITRWWALGIT
jgi:hypothetical protein